MATHDIEPSKPDQNAYIERFSWSYRIRASVEAPRQCCLRTVPSNPAAANWRALTMLTLVSSLVPASLQGEFMEALQRPFGHSAEPPGSIPCWHV